MNKKTQQLLQIAKNAYKQALDVVGLMKSFNHNEDHILNIKLQRRIRQIREVNSQKIIMNTFVPEIIKNTLEEENYLISPVQALPYAVAKFNEELQAGRIDSLYRFVTPEDQSFIGGENG